MADYMADAICRLLHNEFTSLETDFHALRRMIRKVASYVAHEYRMSFDRLKSRFRRVTLIGMRRGNHNGILWVSAIHSRAFCRR